MELPGLSGGDDAETERVRTRVRLLVDITARQGKYRSGLGLASKRLTAPEAAIMADLEQHGLDVQQLREVLCGAHVLVDAPDLYERWNVPKSRKRISSHHKHIDKQRYPDLGLKGPLVREKLHGRTDAGTWMQLEKTPASMGGGIHLPSLNDVQHLIDYVVYRITKRNVGPWGLSGMTEKRPMYLSPDLGARVPLPAVAADEVTGAISRLEEGDDTTSASPDLAARFPPPDRVNDLLEISFSPGQREGRGLFGASNVWITEHASPVARQQLGVQHRAPRWELPAVDQSSVATLRAGERKLTCAVRHTPPAKEGATP